MLAKFTDLTMNGKGHLSQGQSLDLSSWISGPSLMTIHSEIK